MATGPQPGDLIIRNTIALQFEVVRAKDGGLIAGPFESFAAAHARARRIAPEGVTVWQQAVDFRGRALGHPVLIPSLASPQLRSLTV